MRTSPLQSVSLRRIPRSTGRFIATALLLGTAACRGDAGPADRAVEAFPPFDAAVVELSPEEARADADSARGDINPTIADGFSLDLWASTKLLADPIGISIDSLGRAFVTGTSRTNRAEIDIRGHQDWMIESMTFQTVEDKRAFYQRELAPERSAENEWLTDFNEDGSHDWRDLTVQRERIYRIEDRSGDGIADFSQVVAEGFDDVISDVAHGVLAYDDQLLLTLSPDIWRLRDTDGDGVMDTRQSLAHGSGIHIGFGGHGLSNPIIGPDGRLYWKMGDLGLDYTTAEGNHLVNTRSGAIIRSEPDGSNMELFATGLRNPQEFAFDEYGNMISADNDGDHPGETERLVYITQGSDAGWRINWQFGKYVDPDNNSYKVWMDEGLFRPRFDGQAAYITPPIAAYHAGPSGLVYNPGTALSEAWNNYYFVSIFPGSPSNARINAFRLEQEGAGFRLADDKEVLRGVLAVGIDFAPDGALYLTDWITGWDPKGSGRIWKFDTPATAGSALRTETQQLIAAPFDDRSVADLVTLLRHPDMRVRTKAQFHLVNREAADELLATARQTDHQLARIHAMWGLGQLARQDIEQAAPLREFLTDSDPEIRAQAARLLGDVRDVAAADGLITLLSDPAPRARFFAAEALGRIAYNPAVQPIVEMLRANDGEDVYLRQAGATALSLIGDGPALSALAGDASRAVRIAAVIALRRMKDPGVAEFLQDADEYVVTEAARAINDDGGIEGALPALAATLDDTRFTNEALVRREVSANLRVGTPEAAQRLARYAVRTAAATDPMRAEAVSSLGVWPEPSILDRVDGVPIGEVQRDTAVARDALATIVEPLFSSGSPEVQVALADAVARLGVTSAGPTLFTLVGSGATPEVRIAALNALTRLDDPRMADAVRTALDDGEVRVRMAAILALPDLGLPEATTVELLSSVVGRGSVAEQQSALASLGNVPGLASREALTRLVGQLEAGEIAPAIQLDVAEAARATGDSTLIAALDRYDAARATSNPVAAYSDALFGGDARAGQRIVFQHPAAQCTRCHTLGGQVAGASVGPPLRGVASRISREQILESLVAPGQRIAEGYGDVGAASAMPPMGGILTHREIRDVVEFLSTLE